MIRGTNQRTIFDLVYYISGTENQMNQRSMVYVLT